MHDLKTFMGEADAFRKKLGEKTFWALSEEDRLNWFKNLSGSYFRLELTHEDDRLRAANVFVILQQEFERRSILIFKINLQDFLHNRSDTSRG